MKDEPPELILWPVRLPKITGLNEMPPITPEVREWLESVEGRLWTPTPEPAEPREQYVCKVLFHAEYEWGPRTGYRLTDVTPRDQDTPPRGVRPLDGPTAE